MTNYRARDFDFEFDAGDLREYETPGSNPVASTGLGAKASFVVLDRFASININASTSLPVLHEKILLRIAHLIAASRRLNMLISDVELVGYGDLAGNDPASRALGSRRADFVKTKLQKLMTDIAPGTANGVNFRISPPAAGSTLKGCVDVRLPATCQVFWADYDLQSLTDNDVLGITANPNIDQGKRRAAINVIGYELDRRLNDRAKQVLSGGFRPAQPIYDTAKESYDAIKELSDMQIRMFRKWHPATTAIGFDEISFTKCFHTFANGQLRSPHPAFPNNAVGEPDTAHFFMFAEFGFLAADSGFDVPAWTAALRAMVGSQEVFMHVYRKSPAAMPPPLTGSGVEPPPATVTHPLSDFVAANFIQVGLVTTIGLGQSDAKRLAEVTAKYSRMGLNALREAHAVNLLRAQTLK